MTRPPRVNAGQAPDPAILLADERLVVIAKPAGLLSVPGLGEANHDCVPSRLARLDARYAAARIVHRLDMETSGVMVLALDADAHRGLSAQFERRAVEKRYTAIVPLAVDAQAMGVAMGNTMDPPPRDVRDPLEAGSGEVTLPIRADLDRRPIQIVDHQHGRASLTRWRVASRESLAGVDVVRLVLEPRTGRTHQLRLHCAAGLGRAIVGDTLYAGRDWPRLLLHADRLAFTHPARGTRVEVESPPEF